MSTIQQKFKLYNTTINECHPIEDNLSYLPLEEIHKRIDQYIATFNWPNEHRFVAVGDAGDSIVYENQTLTQVSDSG